MINLAKHKAQNVHFDENESMNKNIFLVGMPGVGKSVEAQKIMLEIIRQGGTVVALDWHQTLSEDEIFENYRTDFNSYLNDINVYSDGIKCNLFEPLTHPDGISEHIVDVIGATVDALDRTLRLGGWAESRLTYCSWTDDRRRGI